MLTKIFSSFFPNFSTEKKIFKHTDIQKGITFKNIKIVNINNKVLQELTVSDVTIPGKYRSVFYPSDEYRSSYIFLSNTECEKMLVEKYNKNVLILEENVILKIGEILYGYYIIDHKKRIIYYSDCDVLLAEKIGIKDYCYFNKLYTIL